ncbi:MAG TPA: hypothetical protein VJ824_07995 [Bacillota bacterium]|nr:hypothetical protein [Bacillota bacterium]
MKSSYIAFVNEPAFETFLKELQKFGFINYITVHASLNNIAYRGDTSTKEFIIKFKKAFSHDLNQMTDFLKEYIVSEPAHLPLHSPPPEISEVSRTIIALSFPFFLKTYQSK